MDVHKKMVSVVMPTYNHEKYIARAIESILSQKTDFEYELVIGDDASSDRTQEIIWHYASQYPDKIKVICRKKNLGALKNSIGIIRKCQGKYLATCEGDDYWIDNEKLQKQVDFMEANPEYSMCYTAVKLISDSTNSIEFCHQDIQSMDEYLNQGNGLLNLATATKMRRNIFYESPKLLRYFTKTEIVGDRISDVIMLQYGKIKFMPFYSSVYRHIEKKGDSFASMENRRRTYDIIKCFYVCMHISGREYYHLWYKTIAKVNRSLLNCIYKEEGFGSVLKEFCFKMNIIEKWYLLNDYTLGIIHTRGEQG